MLRKIKIGIVLLTATIIGESAFGQDIVVLRPVVEPLVQGPVIVQRPITVWRPAVPVAPIITYRPAITEAPIVTYSPAITEVPIITPQALPIIVSPRVYVRGQPIRNFFRAIAP